MTTRIQRAPGDLAMVQAFVNTKDQLNDREDFQTSGQLRNWFVDQGLLASSHRVDERDLRQALAVREALRALLLTNSGGPTAPTAAALLTDAVGAAQLHLQFAGDGQWTMTPTASGVAGAIGRLLVIVMRAMTEGTWTRLKTCQNAGCRFAFYDTSRNRSAAWCSMAICGHRQKMRAYRQRRRTENSHL